MGRYVSNKRKESGAAAVMDKPVDTAAAAAAAVGRKRKTAVGETEVSKSSIQLKTRRLASSTPDDSGSAACDSWNSTCESGGSDHVSASCCSSSRPRELAKEVSEFVDLEIPPENEGIVEFFATSADNSVDIRDDDGSEKTPSSSDVEAESGELESTEGRSDSNSRRRRSAAEKMPTEAELEEFFTAAENNLQKQFIDKYNYDIVKDEPLEGRYEWIQIPLKP